MIELKACSLLPLSLVLTSATPPAPLDQPGFEQPAKPWASIEEAEDARLCRDRIEEVRAEAGKPRLERGPADPEEPLLMYAVDRQIDGCRVLVPVSDPADIRHSPPPSAPQIIPAR